MLRGTETEALLQMEQVDFVPSRVDVPPVSTRDNPKDITRAPLETIPQWLSGETSVQQFLEDTSATELRF